MLATSVESCQGRKYVAKTSWEAPTCRTTQNTGWQASGSIDVFEYQGNTGTSKAVGTKLRAKD